MSGKRKRTWELIAIADVKALHYWEESWDLPPEGVTKEKFRPPLEEAFLHELGAQAWQLMGKHWMANKRAFAELNRLPPDGTAALACYCAKQALKHFPETGVTEQVFWDEYMLHVLRLDPAQVEQDTTTVSYLKSRVGKPGWHEYLKRFAHVLESKRGADSKQLYLYSLLWDVFPMPLRFWTDNAAADLFSGISNGFNLDKVRNTRRELGLVRNSPSIVFAYRRSPAPVSGGIGFARVDFDPEAAKKHRMSAMLQAFIEFLKGNCGLGS